MLRSNYIKITPSSRCDQQWVITTLRNCRLDPRSTPFPARSLTVSHAHSGEGKCSNDSRKLRPLPSHLLDMAALNVGPVVELPESHRNSPLAPSQEMAYRQKCIDLKRRLSEIESNNDSIRQRLNRERHFQDKMRLNRAILLNHMKDLVENPSKRYDEDKMEDLTSRHRSRMRGQPDERGDAYLLDDSSEISSSDEAHEVVGFPASRLIDLEASLLADPAQPAERPGRIKRARNGTPRASGGVPASASAAAVAAAAATVAPTTTTSNTPLAPNATSVSAYHSSGLPHIAPANPMSPAGPAQAVEPKSSSFRVASSASTTAPTPLQPHTAPHQAHRQSPTPVHQNPTQTVGTSAAVEATAAPPVRPTPPFDQFTAHLVPQLEADNIPSSEIGPKIRETWNHIGEKGQDPWQKKYGEEMMAYERARDEWKRMQREGNSRSARFVNGGGGSGSGGFSAVNS